jgi:hypothetical protein
VKTAARPGHGEAEVDREHAADRAIESAFASATATGCDRHDRDDDGGDDP